MVYHMYVRSTGEKNHKLRTRFGVFYDLFERGITLVGIHTSTGDPKPVLQAST